MFYLKTNRNILNNAKDKQNDMNVEKKDSVESVKEFTAPKIKHQTKS